MTILTFSFFEVVKLKSNVSLYSLDYAEACNELAGPISASLRPSNTASFEEMSRRWRAVTARDLIFKPPAPETNALPLDQLAGFFEVVIIFM